jgi:hypothetical protein
VNRFISTISFAAALVLVSQASAAPTTCAASGSFATLVATNASGGCYVQDHLFSGFTYLSSASGAGAVRVNPNNFLYSTVTNAPDAVGFEFAFTLTASPNTAGNISIGWLVQGVNIISNHLILDAVATGNAVAIAQTTFCKGGPVAGCPAGALDQLTTYKGPGIGTNLSDALFFPEVEKLGVRTTLNVFAAAGGSASITAVRQTIDPPASVPEPAGMGLAGSAIISLYFLHRRRA